jgi:carbamoylphosphate synthase large subunit
MARVASWEGSVVAVNERPSDPSAIASRGTEAGLLAGLVALHISAYLEGLIEGWLAFQESLDGVIKAMVRGPMLRNS